MEKGRKKVVCIAIAAALGLSVLLPGWSQDAAAPPAGRNPFVLDPGVRLWGADVGLGYRGLSLLPTADTTFWAYVGGGYEQENYYRNADGEFLDPGALSEYTKTDPSAFWRVEGAWRLGVDQGFLWNPRTQTNLVEAFLFYRGRYDDNLIESGQLLYKSSIADREGGFLTTFQAGLAYDDLAFLPAHKIQRGVSAEASAEWGPWDASFVRFNATARGFLPLYDAALDSPSNLLSVYMGDFISIDYAKALSGEVPLYIRQTFGGRDQRTGLGGAVRGVDSGAYDANLKAVNNLEVRVNLPALFFPDLVPGIVVFLDAGWYDQVGEPGIASPASGFIASTGAGVYIDVFDIATLALYFDDRLDAANTDGDTAMLFKLAFGLRF